MMKVLPLLLLVATASAQCSCHLTSYNITLRTDLTCDDSTVPGISCLVDGNPPVTFISEVQVLELDADFNVVAQQFLQDGYMNGDTLSYTMTEGTTLQVAITGSNAANEIVGNALAAIFHTDCQSEPVIQTGMTMGWIEFSHIETPPASLCPQAATDMPTSMPTEIPTLMPVTEPVAESIPTTSAPSTPPTSSSVAVSFLWSLCVRITLAIL